MKILLSVLFILIVVSARCQSSKPWDVPYTYGDTLPEIVVVGHVGDTVNHLEFSVGKGYRWNIDTTINRIGDVRNLEAGEGIILDSTSNPNEITIDTVKWAPYWKPKKKTVRVKFNNGISAGTTRTWSTGTILVGNGSWAPKIPDTVYVQSADLGIIYGHPDPWYLTKWAFFFYGWLLWPTIALIAYMIKKNILGL